MCGASGKYKTCILGWPDGWLDASCRVIRKRSSQLILLSRPARAAPSVGRMQRAEIAKHWEIIKRLTVALTNSQKSTRLEWRARNFGEKSGDEMVDGI
jgi:hypothetical protein